MLPGSCLAGKLDGCSFAFPVGLQHRDVAQRDTFGETPAADVKSQVDTAPFDEAATAKPTPIDVAVDNSQFEPGAPARRLAVPRN